MSPSNCNQEDPHYYKHTLARVSTRRENEGIFSSRGKAEENRRESVYVSIPVTGEIKPLISQKDWKMHTLSENCNVKKFSRNKFQHVSCFRIHGKRRFMA